MKIVFLDAKTLGKDADISKFRELGEVEVFETTQPSQTLERVMDADIIVTNKVRIDAEILTQAKNLRLICVAATGTDIIDLSAAEQENITVCNVAGYATPSVAQHTFALLFGLLAHLVYHDTYVKTRYNTSEIFTHLQKPFWEIAGKTFGIIGLGAIGKEVARIATAFGANVQYYSTSGKNICGTWKKTELDKLMKTSDIVSIHAPLNTRTHHLITYEKLRLMQPHSLILNLGRGGIISESDLARALDENIIAGAGCDVFEHEPIDPKNPLLHIHDPSKILLTPHIAWASTEARMRLIRKIYSSIASFLANGTSG